MVLEFLKLLGLMVPAALVLAAILCALFAFVLTHPPRVTAAAAATWGWALDPADAGHKYEEWILDRPDGARLAVWEIENPARPDAPVIIMSHSWGASRLTSLQRVGLILDEVSRVVMWDMRGHGESEGAISTLGTREIDDLLELIDRCARRDERILLYGMSMGAGVSICAATRCDRVIGVIADGPYRWSAEPVRSMLRINGLPAWFLMPIVHRYLCLRLEGLRASDRAKFAAKLHCPLLLVHGTDDPVISVESAMEIAEAAPNAEFVLMPDAQHLNLHLAHPREYAQVIEDFIRKCAARPARSSTDPTSTSSVENGPAGQPRVNPTITPTTAM